MLILGVLFVGLALIALFFALGIFGKTESDAQVRLRDLTSPIEEVKDAGALHEKTSAGFARRLTPQSLIDRIERNYMLAGRPEEWSVAKVLSLKFIMAAFGIAAGVMFYDSFGGKMGLLLLLGMPVIGYIVPDVIINGKARSRQEQIQVALPDMLDQITISIESGSSFENALARTGHTGNGPLSDEIVRTVQDIALGIPRRDAYDALVERTDVEELRTFVRAIIQGEEFGVSVSEIVRDQAAAMRVTRRLRAEAKANEIPVKMLFPLMGTILPVLFLIVIGPAVLNALEIFRG